MKKQFIGIILLAVCTAYFSGCTSLEYVKNSEINEGVAQVPVHLVKFDEKSKIDFSLNLGYNGMKNIRLYNDSTIENSTWQTGDYFAEVHLDYKIWNNYTVFGGWDFANTSKGIMTGGVFGIGILSEDESYPTRIDIGLKFNTSHRKVLYIYKVIPVLSNPYTVLDSVNGTRTSFDFFASIVLNTDRKDWLVNPFFRAAYIHQNILHLNSRDVDNDSALSLGFGLNVDNIILSTGGSIDLSENIYLIAGLNCNILYSPDYMKIQTNFMPFVNLHYKM